MLRKRRASVQTGGKTNSNVGKGEEEESGNKWQRQLVTSGNICAPSVSFVFGAALEKSGGGHESRKRSIGGDGGFAEAAAATMLTRALSPHHPLPH